MDLAELCGTWATTEPGGGICPRGTPIRFHETLSLTRAQPGDAWLHLVQRATDADSGATLHAEHGFLRPVGRDRVELAVAMNSGRLEIGRGPTPTRVEGVIGLVLTSEGFLNDRLQVLGMRRTYRFDLAAGTCDKLLELATGLGWPDLTRHLWSTLTRS